MLTAPDFERLARTPCPIASLASSGMRPLSSVFAFSCSDPEEARGLAALDAAPEFLFRG
jgi:hypothetical protein